MRIAVAPLNPTGPLARLIQAEKPKKQRCFGLRAFQFQIIRDRACSAYWKDFFPQWCKQHGIPKTARFSETVWLALDKQALDEYQANHARFRRAHDELLRAGKLISPDLEHLNKHLGRKGTAEVPSISVTRTQRHA